MPVPLQIVSASASVSSAQTTDAFERLFAMREQPSRHTRPPSSPTSLKALFGTQARTTRLQTRLAVWDHSLQGRTSQAFARDLFSKCQRSVEDWALGRLEDSRSIDT
eukprot:2214214-Pleurochrysis_carterae.AAC.3